MRSSAQKRSCALMSSRDAPARKSFRRRVSSAAAGAGSSARATPAADTRTNRHSWATSFIERSDGGGEPGPDPTTSRAPRGAVGGFRPAVGRSPAAARASRERLIGHAAIECTDMKIMTFQRRALATLLSLSLVASGLPIAAQARPMMDQPPPRANNNPQADKGHPDSDKDNKD